MCPFFATKLTIKHVTNCCYENKIQQKFFTKICLHVPILLGFGEFLFRQLSKPNSHYLPLFTYQTKHGFLVQVNCKNIPLSIYSSYEIICCV